MQPFNIRKIAAAVVVLSVAYSGASAAYAQSAAPREAVISVSGEAQATVPPDMAILTLGVVKQAETAEKALKDNSEAMAKVLSDLKSGAIAERDLQTSNFSIQPVYKQGSLGGGDYGNSVVTGFQVSNGLTVKVRDLARLGEVIDRSVKLGINQGGNIEFTNENPDDAIADARKTAVSKARAKAETLAEASGVKLGRIMEISENFSRPMPQPIYRAAMMKEASDSVSIAAGENTYTVTVNITYGIQQ